MSAQTSDIQQVMSKTQAVERLYQTHKQQPDSDQQKFAANLEQKVVEKNQQTQETAQSEKGKILKDKKDKLTLSFKKKKKKKKTEDQNSENEEAKLDDDLGRIIDIKI